MKNNGSDTYCKNQDHTEAILYNCHGLVLALTIFSVTWQMYQRKRASVHQQVLSDLSERLGCFDTDDPIFPKNWKTWGKRYTTFSEQIRYPSKVSATVLAGLVALISLWIGTIM